jgi:Fur family transcriptional regulator, ferric uptake regulator
MKNGSVAQERAARWREYRLRTSLKHTASREAIVEAFLEGGEHISLEQLLAKARRKHAGLGLATVHRTMKLLEDAGLAERRDFQGETARYEAVELGEHHDHMICTQCSTVIEFESEEIEQLQREVAKEHGFAILRHRHELYGVCQDCKTTDS